MRLLIAVITCHKYRNRADLERVTWVPEVRDADVRFFVGGGEAQRPDEIVLDCSDDYDGVRVKVQRMFAWALAQGYDRVFKTDDDVYVIPDRLIGDANAHVTHYAGRVRGPSQENIAPRIYGNQESSFCSGFGYWLTAHAVRIVVDAPDNGDWAEDRFVGNALWRHQIIPFHDPNILLWPPLSGHLCHISNGRCAACVQQYNRASVLCPYTRPGVIQRLHQSYKETAFIPTWIPE